jgi:hypothetical protein
MKTLITVVGICLLSACNKDVVEPSGPEQPIVRHLYATVQGGDTSQMEVYVARATQSRSAYHWTSVGDSTYTLALEPGSLQASVYRKDTIEFVSSADSQHQVTVRIDNLDQHVFTVEQATSGQVVYRFIANW